MRVERKIRKTGLFSTPHSQTKKRKRKGRERKEREG